MDLHSINQFITIAADNAGELQSINRGNKSTHTQIGLHIHT